MNYKKSKTERIYGVISKLLLLSTFVAVVVGIFLYTNNVRLSKGLSNIKEVIVIMDEEIANNKNVLYAITDFQDVDATVAELGLIKELTPGYLDLKEASQLGIAVEE